MFTNPSRASTGGYAVQMIYQSLVNERKWVMGYIYLPEKTIQPPFCMVILVLLTYIEQLELGSIELSVSLYHARKH